MNVLHDETELVVLFDDIEGHHDVRVGERGSDARLLLEERHELGVARVLRVEALDRDGPAKAGFAEHASDMDEAIPPDPISGPNTYRPMRRPCIVALRC